jgi:hypothetical protein
LLQALLHQLLSERMNEKIEREKKFKYYNEKLQTDYIDFKLQTETDKYIE